MVFCLIFYGGEYLSDPKMLGLSAHERSCWITLLSYASLSNGVVKHLPEESLMIQAGIKLEELPKNTGLYEKFNKLEMIQIDSEMITIKNWKKRQEMYLTGYERVKKWREKKRADNETITLDKNRIDKNRIDTNDFLEFYKLYPRKINKKGAQRSWDKIDPKEHGQIFTALEAYKKSEQWLVQDGKFIPYPATWLNQERWKDELPAPPPKKAFCEGKEMKQFNGKWKVLEKGQWLEYGGKLSEIEWR